MLCFHATGGHFGRDKSIDKVCSRVYWGKNMTAEIMDYVKRCDVCQRVNDRFHKPPATLQYSNRHCATFCVALLAAQVV